MSCEQKYESTKQVTHSVDNFVRVNLASLKMIKTVIIVSAVIACINAEVNFGKFNIYDKTLDFPYSIWDFYGTRNIR